MAIEDEATLLRRAAADRASRVKNLMADTAAPEWICEIALEAVGYAFGRASELRLAQQLQQDFTAAVRPRSASLLAAARKRADEISTRAREQAFARGAGDGRAAALAAIERDELYFVEAGLMVAFSAVCPRCLTRQSHLRDSRLIDGGPPCPACGARRVGERSSGCVVGEADRAFNAAFNAGIEEHLRATVNPAFRRENVRDEGPSPADLEAELASRSLATARALRAAKEAAPPPPRNEQTVVGEAIDRGHRMVIRATPVDRALDWDAGDEADLLWDDGTRSRATVELRTGKLSCPPGSTVQLLLVLATADVARRRELRAVVVEREATRVTIEIGSVESA
jgi:hypothetical protein